MEKKKKKGNGGVYIAICSCAVIVAMVGYAGRLSLKESEEEQIGEFTEVQPISDIAQTSQEAEVEVEDKAPEVEPEVKPEQKTDEKVEEKPVVKNDPEVPEVIEFTAPVKGKVIEGYMGDDLVYNEALGDWRAHGGVDFSAKIGEEVRASAGGVIEKVFDSNMGRCVIIDHKNGFKTMYANLEEDTKVKEGDTISAGDVVGKVGNTALGDITDLEHVHFEMMKDGKTVNPVEFLN